MLNVDSAAKSHRKTHSCDTHSHTIWLHALETTLSTSPSLPHRPSLYFTPTLWTRVSLNGIFYFFAACSPSGAAFHQIHLTTKCFQEQNLSSFSALCFSVSRSRFCPLVKWTRLIVIICIAYQNDAWCTRTDLFLKRSACASPVTRSHSAVTNSAVYCMCLITVPSSSHTNLQWSNCLIPVKILIVASADSFSSFCLLDICGFNVPRTGHMHVL